MLYIYTGPVHEQFVQDTASMNDTGYQVLVVGTWHVLRLILIFHECIQQ